ncbi:MAG: PilZ domain-containing protein [Spirochaetaceae bacterium]|nr:MAG: PilZ domain-containing protein [Spirochaetaceae bacterium]
MGVRVGRIVKEFVFKSLIEQNVELRILGQRKDLSGPVVDIRDEHLEVEIRSGNPDFFDVEENVQVYFLFQNNFHTFQTVILEKSEGRLKLAHPYEVYKNPQRKNERVYVSGKAEVFFTIKGQKVELNFPRSNRYIELSPEAVNTRIDLDYASIKSLYKNFRERTTTDVSEARIVMLRDKGLDKYEEKVMAATGKMLWIPSTEEDFPASDPYPDERLITRRDLVKYEESLDRAPHVITSKLGNILYEKQKKQIHSELFCPILYELYLVGYIYLCNREDRKEKISRDLLEYAYDFSRVLGYSLHLTGYFTTNGNMERRYEAPIIDISASGLLFGHPRSDLSNNLVIHTDIQITVRFPERTMVIGSRVRRKFQDAERCYFGVQFLDIDQEDLNFLYEKLYARPYSLEEESRWEGGTPPPPLDLFDETR